MSVKRIAGNVVWNCAGMAANLMAGFVVVPFLVRHLGQTVYGLWILVASFTNYFSLLDLGIRAAVGRHIAYHKAKNDVEGFNATVNTAMLILGACGVLALLATMGVMLIFFRLYAVPPEQAAAVRIALVLVGVNLLLWLPLNMFDAMLWAMQRFDLINIVDISGALLRVALIFWWVGRGGGLVALAVIQLLSLAGMQAIKAAVAIRLDRTLRISFRHITKIAARGLAGMGFWNLMLAAADIIGGEAPPMIVGARLGVPMVTPYSIAARLVAYGRDFLVASTGVLTPMAIANHAEEKHANQRTLFIEGSKFCLAMAVLCVVAFVVLGRTIIGLWVGPSLENSSRLLVILIIGEALPMSQWVAYSIILGQYHHRILGQINLLDICLSVCLALLLVGHWGLVGVCIGFVLPGMFLRGIFQLVFACRLVNVSAGEYFRRVAAPVLTAALLPAIGLALLSRWRRPESWLELFLYGGLFGVAYMAVMAPALGYHTAVRRHLALRSGAPPEVAGA